MKAPYDRLAGRVTKRGFIIQPRENGSQNKVRNKNDSIKDIRQ
jgi:hypothetical protein